MAHALIAHAGARQGIVADNIARADTPGHRARDLPSFAEVYRDSGASSLRRTRAGHLGAPSGALADARPVPAEPSPNGNTVSLEREMVRAAEIRQQHDLALGISRTASGILRTSLGRARG